MFAITPKCGSSQGSRRRRLAAEFIAGQTRIRPPAPPPHYSFIFDGDVSIEYFLPFMACLLCPRLSVEQ